VHTEGFLEDMVGKSQAPAAVDKQGLATACGQTRQALTHRSQPLARFFRGRACQRAGLALAVGHGRRWADRIARGLVLDLGMAPRIDP
jgi:hypothetical protein